MAAPTIRPVARALVLAAIVVATAAGCDAGSAGAAAPTTNRPASSVAHRPSVDALVADARAARERHDMRTLHAIRARLAAKVGEPAVRQVEAAVSQAVANLAAAEAGHDAMGRARSLAALHALCEPASLASAFGPCPADVAD